MATEKVDPARSMALLWGHQERPNRGPKPGLTVDVIVQTAMKIADAEGMAALSMRRVAEELGVGTMSLYTYVPAKAELFELMVEAAIGEAVPPDAENWRGWLEQFARDSLAGYRRHPWLMQVSVSRGLMGPNQTAALESLLHTISGIGLTGGEMMAVVQMVTGYVRGVAQSAIDTRRVEQTTGMSDEQWWTEVGGPLYDKFIGPEQFPVLVSLFTEADWENWPDPFEFGLQRVLDGIEALINSRSTA